MSVTRKNAGGIMLVPIKAAAAITTGQVVLAGTDGYAVPGSDLSGGKIWGIAMEGRSNAADGAADGDVSIKIYTKGVFKLVGLDLAVTCNGGVAYAVADGAVGDADPGNGVVVGKFVKFLSATSAWVKI